MEEMRGDPMGGIEAWSAFVFRDAVNPSMDAAGETPVSHAPENKLSAPL